jgi:hypothetical protein
LFDIPHINEGEKVIIYVSERERGPSQLETELVLEGIPYTVVTVNREVSKDLFRLGLNIHRLPILQVGDKFYKGRF